MVNEQFRNYLQDEFEDPGFTAFFDSYNDEDKCRAILWDIFSRSFEEEKKCFGNEINTDGEYTVEIKHEFWRVYEDKILLMGDKYPEDIHIDAEDHKLILTFQKMCSFFKASLDDVLMTLEPLLSGDVGRVIDTIYWVGGFGSSVYVKKCLEKAISEKYKQYQFYSPPEAEHAVVKGAIRFRLRNDIIERRKSDATYGIACTTTFIEGEHTEMYKFYCNDFKENRCKNIFCSFVERGDTVTYNERFEVTLKTAKKDLKEAKIPILTSELTNVWYTTDKSVKTIGEILIQLTGYGLNRTIKVVFDISSTEIRVSAYQVPNGKKYVTIVDFLKDQAID